MPTYEFDELMAIDREVKKPSDKLFMGLGWDKDANSNRKHYRKFYTSELEHEKEVLPVCSPFKSYLIKRGQNRGAKSSFWKALTNNVKQDASGEVSTEQIVGKFKAVIQVEARQAR